MILDGTGPATARTRASLCDEGANLISGNFRLDPPDQVFAVIVSETKVGLFGHGSASSGK